MFIYIWNHLCVARKWTKSLCFSRIAPLIPPGRACRGWKLLTFTLKTPVSSDAHNSPSEFYLFFFIFFVHHTKVISGVHLVSLFKKVFTLPENEQRTLVLAHHGALCQSCKYLEMFRNSFIHMDGQIRSPCVPVWEPAYMLSVFGWIVEMVLGRKNIHVPEPTRTLSDPCGFFTPFFGLHMLSVMLDVDF